MTPAQKRPVSLDARVPTVDGHERARHEAVATDGEDELRHLFRLPDARHLRNRRRGALFDNTQGHRSETGESLQARKRALKTVISL
eukprot:6211948-Pleurochrysis_carterae.AAC.1